MIYLDYAANTPIDERVLACFMEESRLYWGNPNSKHKVGNAAKERMEEITRKLAEQMGVKASEIIYTSGASESNNLALKGIAHIYRHKGKHIISTYLEHSSVSGALTSLKNQGYEIDFVDILPNGQVDLEHLKELLRDDTILVSICYVDSELGVKQPVSEIAELLSQEQHCFFHVDATQAVGKVELDLEGIDLVSFSPHKFYGINGTGVLIRKEGVILEPLIHGGASTTVFRSGTPAVANAASILCAVELAVAELVENNHAVNEQRAYLLEKLKDYPLVRINSTKDSIDHILNISVKGVKASVFVQALAEVDICVSIKSACSVDATMSRPVYAVSKDKKNAFSSFRISLSHRTKIEELDEFMKAFKICYQALTIKK